MCKVALPFLLACASTALFSQPAAPYKWSATGPLLFARTGACATALPDGRIFVAGGQGVAGTLRSVELYLADGTFAPAQAMLRARVGHTCTTLSDGRVLVAGGRQEDPPIPAEVFDPATNSWTPAESGTDRWNHTADLLPDGRVLLAGGETAYGPTDRLEWYDPRTNRIRSLPATLSTPRTAHAAAPLPDGSVLVAGGWSGNGFLNAIDVVKLDGAVQAAIPLPIARAGHTATALDNGCILIAGGLGADGDLSSADLFCAGRHIPGVTPPGPSRTLRQEYPGTIRSVGDMATPRYVHVALLLPNNGKVLVAGGFSQGEPTVTSEIFDPETGAFVPAGALTLARLGIAAAADPASGAVLAVGGGTPDTPLAACGILRVPSVAFNKTRYVDGESVTVSGLGWTPGEKVSILLATVPFPRPGQLAVTSNQVIQTVASALGRIQQTLLVTNAQGAGSLFKATATGLTSGLNAASSARQISRTNVSLIVSPSTVLTRQPVLLQAIVQPVTALDPLDGTVAFQTGIGSLGSVSSTGQFTTVGAIGQITDGTSNTIQVGETLTPSTTGFGTRFVAADGSVRFLNSGGAFQFVTRDLPAGANVVLPIGSPGFLTASYAPSTSLYAPNSANGTVSVQKRTVSMNVLPLIPGQPLKVGDPVNLTVTATPGQLPFADVAPTGAVHVTAAPGNVVDASLTARGIGSASQAIVTVTPPAGTRTFSAQYDGDAVYQTGSVVGAGAVTVLKGTVGFTLNAAKPTYTVGEQIVLSARIQHPKVIGATPSGQITRTSGPTQFQGATVGPDLQNTGTIDVNLPVTGFPAPGNLTVTMAYSGDANFNGASAGAILTIAKAVPQITVIPPAQILAGQQAVFVVRATAASTLVSKPVLSGQVTLTGISSGGTAGLVGGAGSATATIRQTFPTAGTFSVAVQYGGDANYQAATSASIQVIVQ